MNMLLLALCLLGLPTPAWAAFREKATGLATSPPTHQAYKQEQRELFETDDNFSAFYDLSCADACAENCDTFEADQCGQSCNDDAKAVIASICTQPSVDMTVTMYSDKSPSSSDLESLKGVFASQLTVDASNIEEVSAQALRPRIPALRV